MNEAIKIIPATLIDYPTMQNMTRFYVYDMTRYMGWECPEDGLFEFRDIKHHFENPEERAFLIKVDDEIAGFILLDKRVLVEPVDWNMGQFFVLAKFQGKGVASKVAREIFKMYPGKWSVPVLPENTKAERFWKKIIIDLSKGNYTEVFKTADELRTIERPDSYAMNILSFDTRNN